MKRYDYVIVGGGLFGGVMAWCAKKHQKSCLVIERRKTLGGNLYCEEIEGIPVHRYGAHIFHTSDRKVWDFVNSLAEFNRYTNCPVASYRGQMYNMPFNMNTFSKLWGVSTPEEAKRKIAEQRGAVKGRPANLEEQAISLVGRDIYERLIKGYTEKQWGRDCKELPAFIIKRLPVRYTYDNNYFNDRYQGIPVGGYNGLIGRLFEGCSVLTETDYLADKARFDGMAERIIYTGTIDAYFGYRYGKLEYRSLRFEDDIYDTDNYQGVAVVNHADREVPYTRTIEHKHFDCTVPYSENPRTVVTREYPVAWEEGMEPYYPVNDERNQSLYEKYAKLAEQEKNVLFGGRLAEYKYYDMDKVIASAMEKAEKEFGGQILWREQEHSR